MGNHLPTRWVFMGTHSPTQFFRGKAYAPEPHATLYPTLLFLGNHFEPPSLCFLYTQRPVLFMGKGLAPEPFAFLSAGLVFLWGRAKPPQDCFPIFFKNWRELTGTRPNSPEQVRPSDRESTWVGVKLKASKKSTLCPDFGSALQ
jgi:hypothetical protein